METNRGRHSPTTTITDADVDSLVQCTRTLNLRDICNMALSCKFLKTVAYSDPIWQRLSKDRWPEEVVSSFPQSYSVREAYLARLNALQQLKFVDPVSTEFSFEASPFNSLHLSANEIYFSQGSLIRVIKINNFNSKGSLLTILSDHRARVTSMRLFPVAGTSLFRSNSHIDEKVLLSSSSDHSIRLWWKGRCHRRFKGHNGPVSTLSDKLLNDGSENIFASGGEDATIRLWSLSSSGKRGQHALKATLKGHEKPISFISVARHRTSLLVSIAKDSKVRVWDTTVSSSICSSCCVGTTTVTGAPSGMRCYESLVYIGAGSSVTAVDLRTMQKAYNISNNQSELQSFEIIPSKFLVCTGGIDKAMLWDIRRNGTEPLSKLNGHTGPVKSLHTDTYKIVTASPYDTYINVWDPNTGDRINTLTINPHFRLPNVNGCSALAVNGCRFVTGSFGMGTEGIITYQDFRNAMCTVSKNVDGLESKFWGPQFYSDSDESDL